MKIELKLKKRFQQKYLYRSYIIDGIRQSYIEMPNQCKKIHSSFSLLHSFDPIESHINLKGSLYPCISPLIT